VDISDPLFFTSNSDILLMKRVIQKHSLLSVFGGTYSYKGSGEDYDFDNILTINGITGRYELIGERRIIVTAKSMSLGRPEEERSNIMRYAESGLCYVSFSFAQSCFVLHLISDKKVKPNEKISEERNPRFDSGSDGVLDDGEIYNLDFDQTRRINPMEIPLKIEKRKNKANYEVVFDDPLRSAPQLWICFEMQSVPLAVFNSAWNASMEMFYVVQSLDKLNSMQSIPKTDDSKSENDTESSSLEEEKVNYCRCVLL